MDEPKCGQIIDRIRYGHRYQGLGVLCIDCGEREIRAGDRPAAPVELVATSPRQILGMKAFKTAVLINDERPEIGVQFFKEHILVATSDGVFERGEDGVFRECEFERKGD